MNTNPVINAEIAEFIAAVNQLLSESDEMVSIQSEVDDDEIPHYVVFQAL